MPLLTAPATHHHHHHHHHLHHHHHPLLLTFMGSGTGANSGSGSSSSSNSPPPVIKTEPKDLPEEGEEVPPQPPPPSSPLSSGSPGQPRSPPVGLLNHRHLVGDEKLVVATLASLQHSGDPSHLIKQDLRLIIQSRRKAEGKGELQVDFQAPPKDELTEEDWKRVRKRRVQNRLAAQRFRQKQREISSSLSERVSELESTNMRLKAELHTLEAEKQNLLKLAHQHIRVCKDFDFKQLTSEELEKRARRRELNRLAAKRSREKCQRRKDTLIQEIQGLQDHNGALEGALGSLVEERDRLVRTLKGHLPRCHDSRAMSRTAQLLALSRRLALLLDWALPGSPPSSDPSPLSPTRQAPPPSWPPPPHVPLVLKEDPDVAPPPSPPLPHVVSSFGGDPAASALPQDRPGPSSSSSSSSRHSARAHHHHHQHHHHHHHHPRQGGRGSGQSEASRELEIDRTAAAAFREEIERRQHLLKYRVSAPPSPTQPRASRASRSPPRPSPPHPPPATHPSDMTHPYLTSPTLPLPQHHHHHHHHHHPASSPTLPFPPQLAPSSSSSSSHPSLPSSSSHPSSSSACHVQYQSYLAPQVAQLSVDVEESGGQLVELRPVSPVACSVSQPRPKSPPTPAPVHGQASVRRPQSLDLRTAGTIPKKDPALRSPPVIPKKNPELRSPVTPKKNPALRSPVTTPKKNPALRSPVHPKKDPALRSPLVDATPAPFTSVTSPPASTLTSSNSSSSSSSGVFKRGPVLRMASFHGVSSQSSGEQLAPLNLSKRRKSEDLGPSGVAGMEEGPPHPHGEPAEAFSGLYTWPPHGFWAKRQEEEAASGPLNLAASGRERASATATSSQAMSEGVDTRHSSLDLKDLSQFQTNSS